MSTKTPQEREIPDKYEQMEHHDPFTLHDPENRMIIMVHERDRLSCELFNRNPYMVTVTQNQEGLYEDTFQSKSHAIDKAKEKAQKY